MSALAQVVLLVGVAAAVGMEPEVPQVSPGLGAFQAEVDEQVADDREQSGPRLGQDQSSTGSTSAASGCDSSDPSCVVVPGCGPVTGALGVA
ncbi:hypothetical protein, partial [Nocardioides dubius]|uniref:hypothetical protein n=1 Tax=Nocardioides dubius TaxID=317019 RepID=UPI0039E86E76